MSREDDSVAKEIAIRSAWEKSKASGASPEHLEIIRSAMERSVGDLILPVDTAIIDALYAEIKPDGTI